MAESSAVTFKIDSKSVKVFDRALELVSNKKNRPRAIATTGEFLKNKVSFGTAIQEALRFILVDPQTSGGLLLSVDAENGKMLISECAARGVEAFVIGRVEQKGKFPIEVF